LSINVELLEKGHRFPPVSFVLDQAAVHSYLEAVEDAALPALCANEGQAWAPPMAVAALALRGLMEAMGLPVGAVHGSQEFEFRRAVAVGERLASRAWVAHRSQRSGWLALAVEMEALDEAGQAVLAGRASVLVPQ
jgi:acyl dehydratase